MTFDAQPIDWQPPPRPEWVRRINEEGECMDARAVVPLDEASLLDSAMRSTALSDFGADDWREPFRVLIRSLDDEADLNLMGRIRTRSELLLLLTARLQIEDWYKRHPEINDEQITQPIMVVGQGRSGTSFLINTLAANPDNGYLSMWEAMLPCPPPEAATYRSDERVERGHKLIDQWNRVTPELVAMHEFGGSVPQECCAIMAINFMSPTWFDALGQVGSYQAYIAQQDMEPAIRYHQRVLKLLQWKNPRRHWVLKDVKNLDYLPTIMKVYPDACIVWPHRDPVRALASVINVVGTVEWGRSDHPFKSGAWEYLTDPAYSAARINAVIDQLDAGVVPPRQIHHVLYRDLVTDPMREIERMYAHFGIALSEAGRQGMLRYIADHPRDSRPPHRFSAGTPEDITRARAAYQRYEQRFNIPVES